MAFDFFIKAKKKFVSAHTIPNRKPFNEGLAKQLDEDLNGEDEF